MKKILLLGDSIRMGYDDFVKEMAAGKYEVYYFESDNGRFASYTLWQANQLLRIYGPFDYIHFNNGYWDMNREAPMNTPLSPIPEYLSFLKRIIDLGRENGAEVIFATTVPIYEDGASLDNTGTYASINYKNSWVKEYNEAALALMKEENVPVNDLYTLMLKGERYYKCQDSLHLTLEGYKVCAKAVIDTIDNLEKNKK